MNGSDHGYFQAKRGLRQGDPLSPYLFVLAMEGLNGNLLRAARGSDFRHHWRCKKPEIIHQCFADDLILFCHADRGSVSILKSALDQFSQLSGLCINHGKSTVHISGVDENTQAQIADILGIHRTTSPITYLGVPLITTKLSKTNSIPLMDRIKSRIRLWTTATLSYAGRLQLINSVLFAIQVYWASKFIFPTSIIKGIESMLSAFLWKGTSLITTGAKVAWRDICFPKSEGGLGVKRIKDWNQAAMTKHLWHIITSRDSLWVEWVNRYLIKSRPFWQISIPSNPTWSWRKILQARQWSKGWFKSKVGNGLGTSFWYDFWLPSGARPINLYSQRMLSTTGLPWNAKVADIISNGQWNFPEGDPSLQQMWHSITAPPNTANEDVILWNNSTSGLFTIASAWDLLRNKKPPHALTHVLWHPLHVPRQSFILWLASRRRLRTMDRCHQGNHSEQNYRLCNQHHETHEHLFFACKFTFQVLQSVLLKANLAWPNLPWDDLLTWISSQYSNRKITHHMIGSLLLSSTVYQVWQERNRRIFKNHAQLTHAISEDILQQIRAQLGHYLQTRPIPGPIQEQWNL